MGRTFGVTVRAANADGSASESWSVRVVQAPEDLIALFRFEEGVPDGLPNVINQKFMSVKASVDDDGDLIVQTPILLHGGLTEENLQMSFAIWKETIEEIAKGLE